MDELIVMIFAGIVYGIFIFKSLVRDILKK